MEEAELGSEKIRDIHAKIKYFFSYFNKDHVVDYFYSFVQLTFSQILKCRHNLIQIVGILIDFKKLFFYKTFSLRREPIF